MSQNFWKSLPKPFFVLAPMEDVTDIVFRKVISEASRPDVFFTEFTNSESYCHTEGKESLRGRLTFEKDEGPIVAHIWGDDPEYFKEMSLGLAKMGYDGIDLNMGCPAPNVFKHGRGSGLILRPEKAAEIIQATKAGGLPVSVKTRLGHRSTSEWKEWLGHLLKQDIANLSIHLRTKTEMSKVDAHWELIPEIMKLRDEIAPNTLITVNGDIMDYQMGMELYEKYGVDGIMIGRGIFHNPYAFSKDNFKASPKQLLNLLRFHLDTYDHYVKLEPSLRKPLKRFFKIYVREMKGASDLRVQLMETKTTDEVRKVLEEFERHMDI
ncbi:tRNA-dihydrouridine synthase [Erysipelothrix urinaevulpis]|uniref:tRNA dihydrouridine synthase n=1 Tax=Erysipelothrix urinaevulpis TaxID=2683717 RepID=UPI001359C773|nr:tRNA-dihydrouridine synthase [Erysipelothrix urinaevulpis]